MRDESDIEEQTPVEDAGRVAQWRRQMVSAAAQLREVVSGLWRHRVVAVVMRVIAPVANVLSRVRGRPAPAPGDADESDDARRKPKARGSERAEAETAQAETAAPAAPRRLTRFLVAILLLTIGTVGGMVFSYRLLARAIDANSLSIENLHEDVKQLQKLESRYLKQLAENRQSLRNWAREGVRFQQELDESRQRLDESKAETEALRGQLCAALVAANTPAARRGNTGMGAGGAAALTPASDKRLAPQKTGTCTMGTANVATILQRCVEQFNRK